VAATGKYVVGTTAGETFQSFIPDMLPPDPMPGLEEGDFDLMEKANRALGRLDGIATLLPDPALFIYFYVRKEALLSSQIEGTQSSLSDLLLFESEDAPGIPVNDVQEVSNYVAAMDHGLLRLRRDSFPLSARLIREIHAVLLSKGRGSERSPGEFRRSQNWVGGTRPSNARFVPPPMENVPDLMANLERFLHDDPRPTPVLIKAAIAHVQFETIHPFLDGNGRLGRLLITFVLRAEGALQEPILYLSLFFKQHRQEYYDHLQRVRTEGDWIGWLRFFLTGVHETCQQAGQTAQAILRLFEESRRKIEGLGRRAGSAHRVHEYLKKRPVLSASTAAAGLGMSTPTVQTVLTGLMQLGLVREITGRHWRRTYVYEPYMRILSEGTEPLR